ncbi:MAG: hypothetical protein H0X03_02300 [Nitrosopumilus sp.]|nr:hypothetical protein [Nitrosopumilus sp.]
MSEIIIINNLYRHNFRYELRNILNLTKYKKYLIIAGIILVVSGTIFMMQSNSLVGPSNSSMYNNPEWTKNGFVIIAIGALLVIISTILIQIEKKRRTTSN